MIRSGERLLVSKRHDNIIRFFFLSISMSSNVERGHHRVTVRCCAACIKEAASWVRLETSSHFRGSSSKQGNRRRLTKEASRRGTKAPKPTWCSTRLSRPGSELCAATANYVVSADVLAVFENRLHNNSAGVHGRLQSKGEPRIILEGSTV